MLESRLKESRAYNLPPFFMPNHERRLIYNLFFTDYSSARAVASTGREKNLKVQRWMGELAAVVCNEASGVVKECRLNLYSLVIKSLAIPLFKECV